MPNESWGMTATDELATYVAERRAAKTLIPSWADDPRESWPKMQTPEQAAAMTLTKPKRKKRKHAKL